MTNENEVAVLGAMLIDPQSADIVGSKISPADFSDRWLGVAFGMLIDMAAAGEPIDDHSLIVKRLKAANVGSGKSLLDAVGGVAGVAGWAVGCPNAKHAAAYADAIRGDSRLRQLKRLAVEFSSRCNSAAAKPTELCDWLDAKLSAMRSNGQEAAVSLACAMQGAIDDILAAKRSGSVSGLSTGLHAIDNAIGGLYKSDLAILAARPSIGKTALACQIGVNIAEAGHQVLLVSLEMSSRDIAVRKLASAVGYEVRVLRRCWVDDRDVEDLQRVQREAAGVGFHIWSQRSATMAKIRSAARIQQATTGLDLLIVDYVGLIQSADRRKPRWEAIGEISGELKSLSMELQIPILALSQLNREAEKGKPTLAHLRDAGAIEQDADLVMLLHREARDATEATIDVAKARNGATGEVRLSFDPGSTTFADLGVQDQYDQFA